MESSSNPIDLAVLVLAFRRPEELSRSLEALKSAGVRRVYVNVDGPRKGNFRDADKIREVIEVANGFGKSLNLELRTNRENGGVGAGLVKAISWFFEHENLGIIIEEDVVIEPTSIVLADSMLNAHFADGQIGSVSLFSSVPLRRVTANGDTWRFSAYPSSWYWGTWKDRWLQLEPSLEKWACEFGAAGLETIGGRRFANFWSREFDRELSEGVVPWEALWLYTHWKKGWLSANTNDNYCLNYGYSEAATNSFERPTWYPVEAKRWLGVIQVPTHVVRDFRADSWVANQMFGLSTTKALKRSIGTLFPWAKKLWRSVVMKPMPAEQNDGPK